MGPAHGCGIARWWIAFGVAALAAMVWVSGAVAAFPGANGRIVASRTSASATELVTMEPDGSGQQVVPTPGIDTPVRPEWSPDGTQIAFSDNGSSVYTVAPDGSDLTLVASDSAFHAWSPENGHLTIAKETGIEDIELATGDRATLLSLPAFLGDGGVLRSSPIAWSPDGTRLALTGTTVPTGNNGDIYVLDVASGTPTAITHSPLFSPDSYTGGNVDPNWSPSGNSVVFTCAVWKYLGDLCRVGADGSDLEIFTEPLPLTGAPVFSGPDYRSPVVSPDGTAILDTFTDASGLSRIERRNAAGGGVVDIVAPVSGVSWSDPDWQALPLPPSGDTDGDGVVDAIDSGAGQWNDPISGQAATTGSIISTGGLSILVEDAADPDGVRITTGPGTGPARVSVCGFATLTLPANSAVVVTCGSVTVKVESGPVTIDLGGGASVTVPAGATAKVSQVPGGTFSVQSIAGGALTLKVDGVTSTIAPGATRAVAAWDFVGFGIPLRNPPTVNAVTAGQLVPLTWRLLNAQGTPVTAIPSVRLTARALACSAGSTPTLASEATLGGLVNLGRGYYLLTWRTPRSYARSCKTLSLDIGDGVTHDALFRFK